jgi:hypothetical protein
VPCVHFTYRLPVSIAHHACTTKAMIYNGILFQSSAPAVT